MVQLVSETTNTFGDWAYVAISKHFKKFQKYENKVLKDKDPEDLHQMRVGMRRLRSAINGFSLGLKLPKKAGEKKVGKIAKILGELRDLDVLLDTLNNQYKSYLPSSEQSFLEQILKEISKRRVKAFNKVKSILNSDDYINLKESLKQWLEKPNYQTIANIKIEYILPDLLLPNISKLLLDKGWLVGVELTEGDYKIKENFTVEEVEFILNTEGEYLHELRKEAKKTRYQMELFTDFYGEDYQLYLKDIKEIQTILGDIQDSVVLNDVLQDILGKNFTTKMPIFLQLLKDNRYKKWQDWLNLQTLFLNNDYRQKLRQAIQLQQ